MITGIVVQVSGDLHPKIVVSVLGGDRRAYSYEATVDTGFTGALTIPLRLIQRLRLFPGGSRTALLANGQREELDSYYANVLWHDRLEKVVVYQSEAAPLVGMDLLRGSRLTVDSWEGGAVIIEEASPA